MIQIESSYIQIYRDLFLQPCVISLPPSYRCVLTALVFKACYAPCQQDDHGVLIDLLPGQFMCTIRHLAEIANVGRKDVEHALEKFIKLKIVGQEVGHRKSIFTILWGIKLNKTGTRKGTKVGQERDTKEEAKASSIIKKEQQQQFVAVFSCLESLNDPSITPKEKLRISNKFPENVVITAVKSVTKKGFVPEETLLKALNAALKHGWKADVVDNKDFKSNLSLAKKLETVQHPYTFQASKDGLVIIKGSNGGHEEVPYKKSHSFFCSEIERIAKINTKDLK